MAVLVVFTSLEFNPLRIDEISESNGRALLSEVERFLDQKAFSLSLEQIQSWQVDENEFIEYKWLVAFDQMISELPNPEIFESDLCLLSEILLYDFDSSTLTRSSSSLQRSRIDAYVDYFPPHEESPFEKKILKVPISTGDQEISSILKRIDLHRRIKSRQILRWWRYQRMRHRVEALKPLVEEMQEFFLVPPLEGPSLLTRGGILYQRARSRFYGSIK